MTPFFELVVPCFNEALSLQSLIQETVKAAQNEGLQPENFQLVLVNNGSSDDSLQTFHKLQNTSLSKWFRLIHLEKNQGYGGGILAGLKKTTAPWVGFFHADLQCPPQFVFQAFQVAKKRPGKVLVRGQRRKRTWLEIGVSRAYEFCVGITWRFWRYEINAQPKVFSRDLIQYLEEAPTGIPFDAFVLLKAKQKGFAEKTIQVEVAPRALGESHWATGFTKRLKTFWKVFCELKKSKIKVLSPLKSFEENVFSQ